MHGGVSFKDGESFLGWWLSRGSRAVDGEGAEWVVAVFLEGWMKSESMLG